MALTQNWWLMAFLTPGIWAVACLIDSCLIGKRIYAEPFDGVAVSCLFSLIPVVLALAVLTTLQGEQGTHDFVGSVLSPRAFSKFAVLAGLAFAVHLWCYFKTLFLLNDVSGAETFQSLSVLAVPLLAWLLLGEVLPPRYYMAFLIAAAGVLILSWSAIRAVGARVLLLLLASVVAVSLSMVWQSEALKQVSFEVATLYFSLTCVSVAVVSLLQCTYRRRRLLNVLKRYPAIVLCSELLGLSALLSSHRATEFAPSVSLVAMVECLLPVLIIAISLVVLRVNRYVPLLSGVNHQTLSQQLACVPEKLLAFFLMMLAMLLVPV